MGLQLFTGTHRRATECHMSYGITQCYLPARLNPSQAGQYLIYLPRRDGRLSWPWWSVIYQHDILLLLVWVTVCKEVSHWLATRKLSMPL